MNRYSDMTIWELCEERNAIETELATRHSSREPSAAPQENLKGSEAPHTASSHRPDAPPAAAAPDVARMNDITKLADRIERKDLLTLEEWDRVVAALRRSQPEGNAAQSRLAEVEKYWADTEARAADAHSVYQAEAHRRGDVRHPDAYADLSEATKEWDRVLVRWVAEAIKRSSA